MNKKESFYPLKVNYCSNCDHLQLSHSISEKKVFDKYLYLTDTGGQNIEHFKKYALDLSNRFKEKKK